MTRNRDLNPITSSLSIKHLHDVMNDERAIQQRFQQLRRFAVKRGEQWMIHYDDFRKWSIAHNVINASRETPVFVKRINDTAAWEIGSIQFQRTRGEPKDAPGITTLTIPQWLAALRQDKMVSDSK